MVETIAAWLFLSALFAPPLAIVVGALWIAVGGNRRRVEASHLPVAAPAHR